MERQQQADRAGEERHGRGDRRHRPDLARPERGSDGRQQHQAQRHQRCRALGTRPRGLSTGQPEETANDRERPRHAHGGQKAGVEALYHQRPVDRARPTSVSVEVATIRMSAWLSTARMAPNRMFIRSTAEPRRGDDQNAERQRGEVRRRQSSRLAHRGKARDRTRDQCGGNAGDESRRAHRRQRQAAQQETQRRAGSSACARVAPIQAHAAQDQEHADRKSRRPRAPGTRPARAA